MGRKIIIVNKTDRPGDRPVMNAILWTLAFLCAIPVFWLYVEEEGFNLCYLADIIYFYLPVYLFLLGLVLPFAFFIWQRCKKVIYKKDRVRIGLKILAVCGPIAAVVAYFYYDGITISRFNEGYENVGAVILFLVMSGMTAPVMVWFVSMCDCGKTAELSDKPLKSFSYSYDSSYYEPSGRLGSSHESTDYGPGLNLDMTSDYYGKHGEFDTNDRIRAHMEDMEQMSRDEGFDPHDHGYDWDEISDARNDGYI